MKKQKWAALVLTAVLLVCCLASPQPTQRLRILAFSGQGWVRGTVQNFSGRGSGPLVLEFEVLCPGQPPQTALLRLEALAPGEARAFSLNCPQAQPGGECRVRRVSPGAFSGASLTRAAGLFS